MKILIKIGGSALQDPQVGKDLCMGVARLCETGNQILIVHGGGPEINRELIRRGIQWTFIEGQRVTSTEMMEVIELVLRGQVNRGIVRQLQALGVNSWGCSGVDGRFLECRQMSPELGQVGQIEKVNCGWIEALFPLIPVIAPIGIGRQGQAFNINADWAAAHIAQAMRVDYLIYLTDQEGVLNQEGLLISRLNQGEMDSLIHQGVVRGGMLAKCRAIQYALQGGIPEVRVMHGRRWGTLRESLLGKQELGTQCVAD